MAYGSEEAYRYDDPNTSRVLDLMDRQTQRDLANRQQMADDNRQREQNKWKATEEFANSYLASKQRQEDKDERGEERQYQRGRESKSDARDEQRFGSDMEAARYNNALSKSTMEENQRKQEFMNGTEEGQAGTRESQLMGSNFQSELDKPANEKATRDLNNAATRSQIASNNASMGMTAAQIKKMEQDNVTATEDRRTSKAIDEFTSAFKLNDQNAIAAIDAKYADLGPGALNVAKSKAKSAIQQGSDTTNLLTRSTDEGRGALNQIAELNTKVDALADLGTAASTFKKAGYNSHDADVSMGQLSDTLARMGYQKDAEDIKGSIGGFAIGGGGFTAQARVDKTMMRVKGDLQAKATQLKNQYGSLPGNEVQGALQRLNAAIANVDMMMKQNQRNGISLIGGQGGTGAANGAFLQGGGGGSPPPGGMGKAAPLPVNFQGGGPAAPPGAMQGGQPGAGPNMRHRAIASPTPVGGIQQ